MTDEKVAPAMTLEHKLKVVLAHREYIKADAEAKLAGKTLQTALQTLSDTVDQVGIELGLEKGKYTVNLDQLVLLEVACPTIKVKANRIDSLPEESQDRKSPAPAKE